MLAFFGVLIRSSKVSLFLQVYHWYSIVFVACFVFFCFFSLSRGFVCLVVVRFFPMILSKDFLRSSTVFVFPLFCLAILLMISKGFQVLRFPFFLRISWFAYVQNNNRLMVWI